MAVGATTLEANPVPLGFEMMAMLIPEIGCFSGLHKIKHTIQ